MYYLAVDQGGSKTEAMVFDQDGEVLSFADDRDIRMPGESYGMKQGFWIRSTAQRALDKAKVPMSSLSRACFALNGADWPVDYERLQALVSDELSLPKSSVLIVNDCVGAMRGGAGHGNRAVLCVGTGMNCAVQSEDGRIYVYGYFITANDQGGGALGTHAWNAILDAYSGLGEQTLLTELVLQHYHEGDLVSLFTKFTTNTIIFRKCDLCTPLMRAAKAGDQVALDILSQTGGRMMQYVTEGAKKLGLANAPMALVLTGGVFKGDGDIFYETLCRIAREKAPHISCVQALYEPVAGAALLLIDEFEAPRRGKAIEKFDCSAPRFSLCRSC